MGWRVMAGVLTAIACGSSDAHINPAVTLGMAIAQGDFSKVATYYPGADAGRDGGGGVGVAALSSALGRDSRQGREAGLLLTGPAIKSTGANIFSEVIGTFMLVPIIGAIFSKSVSLSGPAPALGPFLVGVVVWVIGLCLGGTTGFAINPARDLGPRIMHAILPIPGKGGFELGLRGVPLIGEVIGGVLAGALIKAALSVAALACNASAWVCLPFSCCAVGLWKAQAFQAPCNKLRASIRLPDARSPGFADSAGAKPGWSGRSASRKRIPKARSTR